MEEEAIWDWKITLDLTSCCVLHLAWYSPLSLFFYVSLFCKEEVLLVKEITKRSEILLGVPLLALELEVEFLRPESDREWSDSFRFSVSVS